VSDHPICKSLNVLFIQHLICRQLDKERNSPMEIEVILGVPLKRAKAKGLSVPHLEFMHSLCSATNALILKNSKL
jgi:hypothetical protein